MKRSANIKQRVKEVPFLLLGTLDGAVDVIRVLNGSLNGRLRPMLLDSETRVGRYPDGTLPDNAVYGRRADHVRAVVEIA